MAEVLILSGSNTKGNQMLPKIKLPQKLPDALKSGAYGATGMIANRFVAPRLTSALNITDENLQTVIKAATGIAIGAAAMQLLKNKDMAIAMTTGALAESFAALWNRFAPASLQLQGDLGLVVPNTNVIPGGRNFPAFNNLDQFNGLHGQLGLAVGRPIDTPTFLLTN